ncbi:hypothetical protein [Aestuariimicrobium ganziense]|uniref:hypothetical protein n=1 Tax=Aestuariimicrobium ganziense TaxID=2773677 RepID=UPI001943E354|nr:hypothetical protein [Aestuariimicrobium ganziense]
MSGGQGDGEVCYQGDTIVLAGHRGRGLGLGLKQANIAHLGRLSPRTRRIHTWNAGENDHMWAINEALGQRTASIGEGWHKPCEPQRLLAERCAAWWTSTG